MHGTLFAGEPLRSIVCPDLSRLEAGRASNPSAGSSKMEKMESSEEVGGILLIDDEPMVLSKILSQRPA